MSAVLDVFVVDDTTIKACSPGDCGPVTPDYCSPDGVPWCNPQICFPEKDDSDD